MSTHEIVIASFAGHCRFHCSQTPPPHFHLKVVWKKEAYFQVLLSITLSIVWRCIWRINLHETLYPKWKEKNEWMNEWRNENPQKCMCIPNVSFPAWKDLLKFDTTAWNSSHWSIYCASAKVKSYSTTIALGYTFVINELDLQWHDFTVAILAILSLYLLKMRIWDFFKPLLTWVMIKHVDTSVTDHTNLIPTCNSGALYKG